MIEGRPDGLLWLFGPNLNPILVDPASGTTVARIEMRVSSMTSIDGKLVMTTLWGGLAVLDDIPGS